MSANRAMMVMAVLAMLGGVAAAEDAYTEIDKLVGGKSPTETREAARARWQKAKEKLDTLKPGDPKDYRHCYYKAIALFRLDGPEAARDERRGCTLPFINGTRNDGKQAEAVLRANAVNQLNALVEDQLQAQVTSLKGTLQVIKDRGKSTVVVATKSIQDLVKTGRITAAEGKKLVDQLGSVDATFDLKVEKLDPRQLNPSDIDWEKFDPDQVPADFKDKLLKHKQGAGTGVHPPVGLPNR